MKPTIWAHDPILRGGGECGALMRAMDWSSSPLGPPSGWPAELRTVVGIALGSSQPMLIVWGPEQTTLYNDGYAVMCGLRHPASLGGTFRDLWYDIWDTVEPIITDAYNGVATSMDDIEFIMHRKGYPEETHFSFSYTPVRDGGGRVLGMFCVCTETTSQVVQRRQQIREQARLIQLFENAIGAVAMLTGPDHVFTYANADYVALVGQRDLLNRPVCEALPEVEGQGFVALLDQVYATGRAHAGRNIPVELHRHAAGTAEKRMIDFLYQPTYGPDGEVDGIFVQALDVTARVEGERLQKLLNQEIGHRMKNQLAIVQAIVNQTLRRAADLRSAGEAIRGRLRAMATAHDRLIAGSMDRAPVGELVAELCSLYDAARIRAEGPEVTMNARAALSLSLILHELATNAAKYGSLSAPGGEVAIRWSVEEAGRRFVLSWIERGGPPVAPPERTGAGTVLIKVGLLGDSDSDVRIDYLPEGLQCRIAAALALLQPQD